MGFAFVFFHKKDNLKSEKALKLVESPTDADGL